MITGEGLARELTGADAIIDVLAGPNSEQWAATEFFTTATRNLQQAASGQAQFHELAGLLMEMAGRVT